MLKVKEIYDFFNYPIENNEKKSLRDLVRLIPDSFIQSADNSREYTDMALIQEYFHICQKMCEDFLLMNTSSPDVLFVDNSYVAAPLDLHYNPTEELKLLEYGYYDFKYRGFVYTRDYFLNSVLPIDGIKMSGNQDIGTAFYIGENRFVTAAHCVNDMAKFRLLLPDGTPIKLREVWYAKEHDMDVYDLAVIVADGAMEMPSFDLDEPAVLDDVLVMGYPPISGFNAIQTAETATVGSYQKASIGQVVGTDKPYGIPLDFFLINARVKGGNSGGPVINNTGCVVGVVVKLPYDSQSSSDNPRYDLMGYGVCLPSKYIKELMQNPEVIPLAHNGKYYHI